MAITDQEFKNCLRHFPTGVTIATAYNNSQPYGVTISSFTSLSLNPKLIMFALYSKSSVCDIFQQEEYFAINILCSHQRSLSLRFAHHSNHERWENIPYDISRNNLPLIDECLAYIECKKYQSFMSGDHVIFIGEVLAMNYDESKKPPNSLFKRI